MSASVEPAAAQQVVVVGAGPTGLLLAGDLAAAGVPCTVLERRGHERNLTRAFAVHARTLEEFDARGIADDLVATGARIETVQLFGDVRLDLSGLPSRFPYLLITPQYNTEAALEKRAREAGAEIVTGAEVVGLTQDGSGVDLEVRSPDGTTRTQRATYVVGADGVRSVVRRAIGLPYPGKSVLRSIMLADVRLERPPANVLAVNGVGDSFAFIAPFGDGWYRIFAWERARQVADDEPLQFEEVVHVAQQALGDDYGMHSPRWLSRFHSDERQVPQYRVGRVFLAGDAAHCHSPAGGQGMNTGVQDAVNLSWKLAAAVQGWAPDGLLDSYHSERHPVGRQVLRSSGALIRMAMLRSGPARSARGLIAGAALSVEPIARRITGMLSGVGVEYARPPGAHPSVGDRIGDVPLRDGPAGRLYEALRGGRFVLLTREALDVGAWSDRVVTATPAGADVPLTLVRPDGYVAWARSESDPSHRRAALEAALAQWCGPAR